MVFEDLGDSSTRLHTTSLCDDFGARDAWLASGMRTGSRRATPSSTACCATEPSDPRGGARRSRVDTVKALVTAPVGSRPCSGPSSSRSTSWLPEMVERLSGSTPSSAAAAHRCSCCTVIPQTHVMWHAVLAGALAKSFTLWWLADLRGYGYLSRPPTDDAVVLKGVLRRRIMATDHDGADEPCWATRKFVLAAHDRGARVAHRLALDHPQRVQRLMLLDIAPTLRDDERPPRPKRLPPRLLALVLPHPAAAACRSG